MLEYAFQQASLSGNDNWAYIDGKGKNYAEWKAEHEGRPTIRGLIRDELDEIIKCSYSYQAFWKELCHRGYEIKDTGKYIALKPTFSQRYIRLKSLGENYSEESIKNRIIMARNGIRELDKPKKDYNAWIKKYESTKLHGFKALYFHYLYLFGKIRKQETPQRISFYMREELVKFERYQKQFLFLYDNDIETMEQLTLFKANAENKIDELTMQRKQLYGKDDTKDEIAEINKELRALRKDVRMCDNIIKDVEVIEENTNFVLKFEKNEKNKMRKDMPTNDFRSK